MNLLKNRNLLVYLGVFAGVIVFHLLRNSENIAADSSPGNAEKIDRHALVTRHNPVLTQPDKLSPLSVGNGDFAFTADVTGLQTFSETYIRSDPDATAPGPDGFQSYSELEGSTPLAAQSRWGWHSFPNPANSSQSHGKLELGPHLGLGLSTGCHDGSTCG